MKMALWGLVLSSALAAAQTKDLASATAAFEQTVDRLHFVEAQIPLRTEQMNELKLALADFAFYTRQEFSNSEQRLGSLYFAAEYLRLQLPTRREELRLSLLSNRQFLYFVAQNRAQSALPFSPRMGQRVLSAAQVTLAATLTVVNPLLYLLYWILIDGEDPNIYGSLRDSARFTAISARRLAGWMPRANVVRGLAPKAPATLTICDRLLRQ